ncbi:hypothetical protein GXB78_06490 [Pseudomonas moraviensis subsp. stanleyae]|uniref:hypothetical protein n=1 Tax=Pseudomonas moraviensis TaxID=321662 RepID=UPI002E34CD5C|nr:hypothetical protein [Pseudomonas moraviensis]MED7666853.1 hypothetical protein [Pseudomonas moraviensis subsp. stanleyae]
MIPDKKSFMTVTSVHDLFDIFGAIATMIAAAVAVIALSNWRSQFRHAARFESLKALKDAATRLHTFRKYLLTVQARCIHLMQSGGVEDLDLRETEEEARKQWTKDLEAYNQAWGTAAVFFTPDEESAFSGPAPVFVKRSLDDPLRIVMAYANAPSVYARHEYLEQCRLITDEVRHLYAATVSELEWMLRQKYRQ